MPAGLPYFAWVDPTETPFEPEHMRWNESVFSFTLKQDEGDPASLTLVVRRPRNDTRLTHEPERFFGHAFDAVAECAGHEAVRAHWREAVRRTRPVDDTARLDLGVDTTARLPRGVVKPSVSREPR